MLKRAGISVGIVAVLLTGILPGGDTCALAEAANHACCAEITPEPTSSCCSMGDDQDRVPPAGQKLECDCAHPTSTPIVLGTSGSSFGPETQALPDLAVADLDTGAAARTRSIERRVRSHPPPPAFLLNCANLN